MSSSSEDIPAPNFQFARQLFESGAAPHYYLNGGKPFGTTSTRSSMGRPTTTYIETDSKTNELSLSTSSLPTAITESSPTFKRSRNRNDFVKPKEGQTNSYDGRIGRRKNSNASILSETLSTCSSTSSSSTSAKLSLSKLLKKGKEKILSVGNKRINNNEIIDCVNSNVNNSDNDEKYDDKTRRLSYKHVSVIEGFLDRVSIESTDTDDDTFRTTENPPTNKLGKIHHILEELINTEEEYIKKLEFCIENYIKYIDNDHDLPVPLKGQQQLIFSEIEIIYDFHKNRFYPALADCNFDIDKIIDRIRQFVREDCFYPYVLYAMNKQKSERVVKVNENHFIERQNEIGDRLGLPSLLMEPIQRLPKYRLLIYEMIKDYMKHYLNKNTTSTMESLCRAEKEMQRVLDAANESITLNDIVIDDYQINLHHQGKFLKSGTFEMHNAKANKKFSGKLFLFTYSLIYTEYSASNKRKLIYHGYFDCRTFGIRQDCNEVTNIDKKFYIFDTRPGQNEIEFVQTENNTDNWYNILQPIMMNGIKEGKTKSQIPVEPLTPSIMRHQTFRLWRGSRDSNSPSLAINSNLFDYIRVSNASTMSSGIGSNRSSRCSTTSTLEVVEDTVFDKIIYSEKHYVHYLKSCSDVYLNVIEDKMIAYKLHRFSRSFEQILSYHQSILYPKFQEFEMGYASIFYLYEMYLGSNILESYINYAVVASTACDILKSLYKDKHSKSSAALPIEEFIKLPIYRNKYYLSTLDQFIKEYMRSDYRDAELLEHAACLQTNFSNIQKQIDETFKVYSIKQNTIKLFPFGICEYTDIVSLDIFGTLNHRICIMENGLICIKFKTISDIQEEHYREIVFSHPYSKNIHLRVSKKNPNKLHIDTVDQKAIAPSLTFRSAILTTKFSNLISQKLENLNETN